MNKNKIHKSDGKELYGSGYHVKCGNGAYMRESKTSGLWKDVTCRGCLKIGKRRRHNDI
jgi:hypothetical protein